MKLTSTYHICSGSGEGVDWMREQVRQKKNVRFPLPKIAKIADVVFYFAGSIYAHGKILSNPAAGFFGKRRVYWARIGNFSWLSTPISLEVLRATFPEWPYLTYPRSYANVPLEYADKLYGLVLGLEEGTFPEEVVDAHEYYEGVTNRVTVNAYERNAQARQRCIEHYGLKCSVCGFSFEQGYGGELVKSCRLFYGTIFRSRPRVTRVIGYIG